jgi:hypothetical protein
MNRCRCSRARTFTRGAAFDIARVVLHKDGTVIESLEPDRAQQVGKPVTARLEFAVRNGLLRPAMRTAGWSAR